MAKKTSKKKTTRKKTPRKKKVDTDLLFVGAIALIAAVVIAYWQGIEAIIWYGMPAIVGAGLIYQAYM